VDEYHSFLSSTVRYFYAIQEAQMRWRWTRESGVVGGLEGVRRLWASQSGVSFHFLSLSLSCCFPGLGDADVDADIW
jgi:hypothetical protein